MTEVNGAIVPAVTEPDQAHEWFSYEDDDGDTYLFDVSFFASNYRCIFGEGCQGVLNESAPELEQGCCSYGAHFVDKDDRRKLEAAAQRLTSDHWQFKGVAAKRGGPIKKNKAGEWTTRLVEDACIFLNRPGFQAGAGCALHTAALEMGERPLDWKPEVCWQVPLRLTEAVEESGHRVFTLREWKRRDWGEGGAEFHWWCTEEPDAFVDHRAAYETLRDEMVEMVGEEPYEKLVEYLESRRQTVFLPHPAVRRD